MKKWLVGASAALLLVGSGQAAEQIAVKFDARDADAALLVFRSAVGADVKMVRPMSGNAWVISLPDNITEQERTRILDSLRAIPGVEWVEAETHHRTNTVNGEWVPNDPNFVPTQWNLQDPTISGNAKGAINAVNAWTASKGDGIVIAIVDNGVNASHPDLQGKLLPGYNFITRTGRGTNTQPPAYGTQCAIPALQNGNVPTMSYHGTSMAGIAAAATNNGLGIAGVAPNAMILPIKVLDECMTNSFDVADGIRFAAGLGVPGVPANAHPARVISISLSAAGSCDRVTQSAVRDAISAGSVVVGIAGNDGASVGSIGSCEGVITTGAIDYMGARTSYTNFGSQVALMAPGGGGSFTQPDPSYGWSVANVGATSYDNNGRPIFNANTPGTSNAAPQVAGVAALMLSLHPALAPDAVRQLLQKSARRFVDESCNALICGAGMLDAQGAVTLAAQVVIPTAKASAPASVTAGNTVALDGSQSSSADVSYAWTQLSGPTVSLQSANTAVASFTPSVGGNYQFALIVTDNTTGLSSSTSVQLAVTAPAATTGGGTSNSGGGGGAFGPLEALLLLAAGAASFAIRRRT